MARRARKVELVRRLQACLSEFSPEEFPVHCPKCDYLLMEPHHGKCLGCGAPFRRADLLASQYDPGNLDARNSRAGLSAWARRWRWFALTMVAFLLLAIKGAKFLYRPVKDSLLHDPEQAIARWSEGMEIQGFYLRVLGPVCLIALFVAATLYSCWKRILVRNRRRLITKLKEIETRRSSAQSNASSVAAPASERELSTSDTSPS